MTRLVAPKDRTLWELADPAPDRGDPPLYLLVAELVDLARQISFAGSTPRERILQARADTIAGQVRARAGVRMALRYDGWVLVPHGFAGGAELFYVLLRERDLDSEETRQYEATVIDLALRRQQAGRLSAHDNKRLLATVQLGIGATEEEAARVVETLVGSHEVPRDLRRFDSLAASILLELRSAGPAGEDPDERSLLDCLIEEADQRPINDVTGDDASLSPRPDGHQRRPYIREEGE